jgi:ATP-dependent DNA helicase RecQ
VSNFVGGLARARTLLWDRFAHPVFRLHQLRVLGPLLAGRDVLAVLPTGAGKSLCYQLPALMAEGLTLVVSPLISLMQDQVAALRQRGIAAGYLSSLLTLDQRYVILDAALAGRLRLLYCATERLAALVARLRAARRSVSLLAVDEAHCITEWGNEFRPVYRRLGQFRYLLGDPPTLALTGSATPATRTDILRVRIRDDRERFARIRALVRGAAGHTIVYAPTRRLTELATRALLLQSLPAAPYHAGLSAATRRRVLLEFRGGRAPVVVATSAFGMGIDKLDVRRVIHWGPPRRLEGYYQEAGRAGRDGRPAECLVLWTRNDAKGRALAPEVRRYLESRACRRGILLEHFGQAGVTCSGCDRCNRR